jgi:hypothetical protein
MLFAETNRTDLDKWSKVVKEANLTLNQQAFHYSALTLRSSITLRQEGISAAMKKPAIGDASEIASGFTTTACAT